ncbi:hypothetical protein [Naasia lichenicola]|uniref:Uncharacterized protein n=1 Tax=Naasia lichenicola TaxID=2565933 RepID=A0A4S4FQ53_9MICO|nr:hypothetical protein [Naasia lichenicola]THG31735.1 hypothetical protein E6C64_06645 [Naasia lichenicola]
MLVRKAFYWWQLASVVVLPVWILVGWAVFGSSTSSFLGVALTAPFLVVALLVVTGLLLARRSVRTTRALSFLDVGVLAAWHAMIIGLGFFGATAELFGVLSIAAGIVAFWAIAWQIFDEARKRVRAVFETIDRTARTPASRAPIDAGEYIVIQPPSGAPRS